MNETQLVRTIKAHIAKGDRASEKSEQHYIAAGLHLKTLKTLHDGGGATGRDGRTCSGADAISALGALPS
jgi:hypothetical protein